MRFSISNILMALLCVCLSLGWYAARNKQIASVNELTEMKTERTQLVSAAILFGQKVSQVKPTEYDHEFPGPNSDLTDKQLDELNAGETLILMMNLENELQKVIQMQLPPGEDGTDDFRFFVKDIWYNAGQPNYDRLVKIAQTSDSNITITNPTRLEELIDTFLE